MTDGQFIELEGVRVNNLRSVHVRIRRNALTVICGVSGSGKSSLAFDTLYAEGQRRYIETFSPSARQFLDRIERPAADRMTGLPPAIALRQHQRHDGSRSTIGTRTEVLESLRVLFARAGRIVCPACGYDVRAWSPESAAADIVTAVPGSKLLVTAQVRNATDQPGVSSEALLRRGFTRAIVNGRVVRLEKVAADDIGHAFSIVVDRLKATEDARGRIAEAIGQAIDVSGGACQVLVEQVDDAADSLDVDGVHWSVRTYASHLECGSCRRTFSEPTPELLSFTSPLGACPTCEGTGVERALTREDAGSRRSSALDKVCADCGGTRLNADAQVVRLCGVSLTDVCAMEIGDVLPWLRTVAIGFTMEVQAVLRSAIEHVNRRLELLRDCGLSYLTLDRRLSSLSGGESQRAGLVAALGCGLVSTLYVLDEPTAGLHPTDTDRVLTLIRRLQHAGNTVVVVEHDPAFLDEADEIIEIGPGAGQAGGTIVFQGTPTELRSCDSATGQMMAMRVARGESGDGSAGASPSRMATTHRVPSQWLTLNGVTCHNICDLTVRVPLGVLCAITGVSGSGKSSLIVDTLYPVLAAQVGQPDIHATGTIARLDGANQIESVLLLDQQPIRRSRRSLPATWIGVFDDMRSLLADTHEARKRNASKALFSFNAKSGGRCPVCEGRGVITVSMQFLADIETPCEDCQGRRFRPDVLEIRYRDRSIDDILNMTADEAFAFFNGHHRIQQRLNAMRQAGLGYLRLGQPLNTVSGGEAQRLRIAAMLAGLPLADGETAAENRKPAALTRAGRTLFLLDEPSTGLHAADLERLLGCFDFLLQTGHSIIVIDHDPVLIAAADWRIELGPGAGREGGRVVREGRGD